MKIYYILSTFIITVLGLLFLNVLPPFIFIGLVPWSISVIFTASFIYSRKNILFGDKSIVPSCSKLLAWSCIYIACWGVVIFIKQILEMQTKRLSSIVSCFTEVLFVSMLVLGAMVLCSAIGALAATFHYRNSKNSRRVSWLASKPILFEIVSFFSVCIIFLLLSIVGKGSNDFFMSEILSLSLLTFLSLTCGLIKLPQKKKPLGFAFVFCGAFAVLEIAFVILYSYITKPAMASIGRAPDTVLNFFFLKDSRYEWGLLALVLLQIITVTVAIFVKYFMDLKSRRKSV